MDSEEHTKFIIRLYFECLKFQTKYKNVKNDMPDCNEYLKLITKSNNFDVNHQIKQIDSVLHHRRKQH
jgi:hypothetical protein